MPEEEVQLAPAPTGGVGRTLVYALASTGQLVPLAVDANGNILVAGGTGAGGASGPVDVTDRVARLLGHVAIDGTVALDAATLAALETIAVANPTADPETGLAKDATTAQVRDRLPITLAGDGSLRVAVQNPVGTQAVSGTFLTNTELRATAVPVAGPLTDTQLRAASVPVATGLTPLTDTQLRATAVPVSGPLTDTQLRATAVPVATGLTPLTDTQLRATAVPVSGPLTDAQIRATALPVAPADKAAVSQAPIGNMSLGNSAFKTPVMKTGNLVTTAVTADQVVLTYTVTAGKTFYLQYLLVSARLTTFAATATFFGALSLESPAATKLLTTDLVGTGGIYAPELEIPEPIPFAAGTVVRVVCTPSAATSFTWKASFGGYEK